MVSEVRFSTRQFPTLEQFSKGVIHTHHIKIRLPLEGSPYCRNLLFHPFRILGTLGPGKEGVDFRINQV